MPGEPQYIPQEQALLNELFDRLARLESNSRDRDAERLIADGSRQAPHAGVRARADGAGSG